MRRVAFVGLNLYLQPRWPFALAPPILRHIATLPQPILYGENPYYERGISRVSAKGGYSKTEAWRAVISQY